MESKTYSKCDQCGTTNLNRDYCEKCGNLINVTLKRKIKAENKATEKEEYKQTKEKKIGFVERLKVHQNPFFRFFGKVAWSVWVLVLAIGGVLAWIAAAVAA
ncbi:transcription initiation factor TFIIIB Brf1 subunit/transcription initiation factor TFIIB [Flavobacterium arsenatis]|uniref:Transcription initiation factor TFIIIB Brf1 subunit/transcription initiation factor TFIIB n=1 Tax=Flavobacterium arsenatis TaxID=1484332 RepID=A0ABU1TMP1_9FLAO|nr:hypothetical protein [Flavobacterium arsenatis]MDR6967228.1 transcription initiation factor TFIIIB Brf1 subunit/transcription initiation factor TFIIB [Flavobacterium arsenatis]